MAGTSRLAGGRLGTRYLAIEMARDPLPDWRQPLAVAAVAALLVVFGWTVGALAVTRWQLYHAGWDLSTYHQAVWLLAHGHEPYLTGRGLPLLGHHVNFLLWPLAWLYRVVPGVPTMLWVQTLSIAVGAPAAYLLANAVTRSRLAAVLWAAVYLWYPTFWYLAFHDFHPNAMAIGPLAWALYLAHREHWPLVAVCLGLVLLVKEDAGLVVAGLGAGWLLTGRRAFGLGCLVAGLGWSLLCYKVILPTANAGAGAFYLDDTFNYLGDSLAEIALAPLLRPRVVAEAVFTSQNLRYTWDLLVPLAGLCLLKPSWLAGGLATWWLNLLSRFGPAQSIRFHYAAYLGPILVFAAIAGSRVLSDLLEDAGVRPATARVAPAALAAILSLLLPTLAPGLVTGRPVSPLSAPATAAWWAAQHPWAAEVDAILAELPADASVAATEMILSKASGRVAAWRFPAGFHELARIQHDGSASSAEQAILVGLARHHVDCFLVQTSPNYPSLVDQAGYDRILDQIEHGFGHRLERDLGAVRLYRRPAR